MNAVLLCEDWQLCGILLQGMDIRPPYDMIDMNAGHLWYSAACI